MNFYAEQDVARRKTRWLVVMFLLAVLVLIALTNVIVALVVYFVGLNAATFAPAETVEMAIQWFTLERFSLVCLGVAATVFLVVLFKWAQLSAGGKTVAERLGGERILPQTDDPAERRCLNVVEEMALAAGLPVPPVYVLRSERGINAFAAGISPADAVIGVTRGSLERFNREQLQGVMAHEFSHILNGDMRLNIRMAALLKGITFIGDVGEMLVRGGSTRGSRRSGNRQPVQLLAAGVALWIVGFLGGLFAGFIKAAVSRQREYLADASAVQFTRNPKGVADALKVIGGHIPGTVIVSARAVELSHIFFGQIGTVLTQFFSTHPPLPERIRRIEPGWDGQYIHADRASRYEGSELDQDRRQQQRREAAAAGAAVLAGAVLGSAAAQQVSDAAADAEFPDIPPAPETGVSPRLVEQAHDPLGATAIAYGLMFSHEAGQRKEQLELVAATGVRGLAATVSDLLPELQGLAVQWRLPLLELSLPALKCLSAPQYRQFKETLLKITRVDKRVDLVEWCLYQVLRHYLDPEFVQVKPARPRHRKAVHVRQAYRTVVSVLAWRGHAEATERERAFTRAVESVGLYNLTLRPIEDCGVAEFGKAVNTLADCYPLLKPRLLKGMALCAAHDGELSPEEREILVAVGAVMDCPVPAEVRSRPFELGSGE